jgi:hypothetical protein
MFFCQNKTKCGIFIENLQNIITIRFDSNLPSSFRGEDRNVKNLQTMNSKSSDGKPFRSGELIKKMM